MSSDYDSGLAWELLLRYRDPATQRFDAVLATAGVDDDTARALRFWQRESVASVKQYAAQALPAVFGALASAADDVRAANERAATAWRTAPGVRADIVASTDAAPGFDAAPHPDAAPDPGAAPHPGAAPGLDAALVLRLPEPAAAAAPHPDVPDSPPQADTAAAPAARAADHLEQRRRTVAARLAQLG